MGLGGLAMGWVTGCGGEEATAPPPVPLTGVAAISAGGAHACAVMRDGTARCWGSGIDGELGNGISLPEPHPVTVAGLSGVAAMAAGGSFTCALMGDATVDCWGDEAWGQLGNGTISIDEQITPAPAVGLSSVVALEARGVEPLGMGFADQFACALLSRGTVACWGENSGGEVGLGPPDPSSLNAVPTPTPVSGVEGATAIGLGDQHACAVLTGGSVSCWGYNLAGQLGDGTHMLSGSPVPVVGMAGPAIAVTGGEASTPAPRWPTARSNAGEATARVRSATERPPTRPHRSRSRASPASPGSPRGRTTPARCARTERSRCWGLGWLGNGQVSGSAVPVQVEGVSSAVAVAAGEDFTCALLADSSVACWGDSENGQLGGGSMTASFVPVAVTLAPGP